MFEDETSKTLKAYGSVFRWGSGLLGKSAIVIGVLILCVFVAIFRLHSDWAIVGAIVLGAAIYFIWYFPLLKFSNEHPAEAMLDGIQWAAHQQTLMAKGQAPTSIVANSPGMPIVSNPVHHEERKP